MHLPMDWEGCSGCRVSTAGIGLDLDYRLSRLIYLDSEFNFFPGTDGAERLKKDYSA